MIQLWIVLEDLSLKKLLLPNDIYLLLTVDFGMPLNSWRKKALLCLGQHSKVVNLNWAQKKLTHQEQFQKVRWVVEAVHGNIAQKYKLLHSCINNKMLPKLGLLRKIVGFFA